MDAAAIIFDCDGVLLDTNRLKIELFKATVVDLGFSAADVDRFSLFQASNFGTSRYRLFETFLAWDLETRPVGVDVDGLVRHYAGLLAARYSSAEETPGMRDVVRELSRQVPLFIASGSDEEELRAVFAERGDADAFVDILGSPTKKADNVEAITSRLATSEGLRPGTIVFVGDAEADLDAARTCGLPFVYMDAFSTVQHRMRELAAEEGFPMIDDLRDLRSVITVTS